VPEHAAPEVTFLFTDIEGSTRLLQELGPEYAPLLDLHRDVITRAISGHGGQVVDCRGDEFFAAFQDARAAGDAAVRAQRELGRMRWPGDAVVRVRMGLHSGRAQVVGDGYVGMAVHHAARVCQTARGGEIIASHHAADQVRFEVRDLGEHVLRGIPRPTRLFRVVAPGVESDFPPLGGGVGDTAAATRVVLADDSVLLREGIARLLEEEGFDVVGQSGTADDLLVLIDETLPDIAIVDIRMPPTKTDEGLRAAREIRCRHPRTGVLVLSQYVEVQNAVELFTERADGMGYLLKDRVANVDEFAAVVRRVADGGTAIDVAIVDELRAGAQDERERAVLELALESGALAG
jgi:class 3 adenylate cyclase/DNA-binding NarL/FixJ family response regulator